MNAHTATWLALILLAGAAVAAQRPEGAGGQAASSRIDPLTASIQGRVTTADTGAPIRRAEVRATAESGVMRFATTDADGRYELRDLPAGRFRVNVSKSGFVPLNYGQRRPFEASTPIDLVEGARAVANMALPRGGVIAGRIYDEGGEPLAHVRVQALRSRTIEGRRRLTPAGAADITDDTGAFRLYALPPGTYYVTARPEEAPLPRVPLGALPDVIPAGMQGAGRRSPLTLFYPGTGSVAEAERVRVDAGGEVRVDIQMVAVRTATVAGLVLDAAGAPVPGAMISLRAEAEAVGPIMASGGMPLSVTGDSGPTGTFALTGVPPGQYFLSVSNMNGSPGEFGERAVTVSDADILDLIVRTAPPTTIEGVFVGDAGVTQPLPAGLRLEARTLSPGALRMTTSGSTTSSFRTMAHGGRVHLQVMGLPDGWAVKAILRDGVDVSDGPLDLSGGGTATLRIVLTDRPAEVAGTIDVAPGEPDAMASRTVVVFPEDPAKWTYPSRYLFTARSDDRGAFRISGLPGNEQYFAAAVDYLEEGEESDPEFLEQIRDRATAFTLREGERRAITLREIRR